MKTSASKDIKQIQDKHLTEKVSIGEDCDCKIPKPMARNLDNSITCIVCRNIIEQNLC